MKVKFDKESDVMYFEFSDTKIAESREDKPGVIIDYDQNGNIVGIEILEVSSKTSNPSSLLYEVA